MALEDYVPVTGDDWYQRRRQDAEGRFWRRVSDQGPRGGRGESTRQGIYCFTADGQLLYFRNGQSADAMKLTLRRGLEAWNKLPESKRKPGAVPVEDFGEADPNYARTPPPGGLILNVFTRSLDRQGPGLFEAAECPAGSGGEAARDHLWITREELRALVPASPQVGQQVEVPRTLRDRIVRFHLVDNTRGEPPHWQPREIRAAELTLTVTRSTPEQIELRLQGSALLSTQADLAHSNRGYDARLLGYLAFDRKAQAFQRFDVVALGDHWGEGPYTGGARPGRSPLGVLFEIATGNSPANRVPPQGARAIHEYLGDRAPRAQEARR